MLKVIDSTSHGAIVTIDNVRYIDSNGRTLAVIDIPIDFNKGKTFGAYKNSGELDFEKIKVLNFISGVAYFSGTGFPNAIALNVSDSNFLQKCFERSTRGTTIKFESCVYKDQRGVTSIISNTMKL